MALAIEYLACISTQPVNDRPSILRIAIAPYERLEQLLGIVLARYDRWPMLSPARIDQLPDHKHCVGDVADSELFSKIINHKNVNVCELVEDFATRALPRHVNIIHEGGQAPHGREAYGALHHGAVEDRAGSGGLARAHRTAQEERLVAPALYGMRVRLNARS